MSLNLPWTIKYRPKSSSDIVGNKKVIESLRNWVISWKRDMSDKRSALLHGPPGTGKTIVVEALAKELELDLIEMNASDFRTGKSIAIVIGSAVEQQDIFQRKKMILLDEIDSISPRKDRGAVQAIVKEIDKTNYPIIMTANDVWDPKVRGLREKSILMQFKRIGMREVLPYLKQLLIKEEIEAEDEVLKIIIERNNGDMRSTINDLQMLTVGKNQLIHSDVAWLAWRDRKESIFDALKLVFTSKKCLNARRALAVSEIDHEMLFEWIYENAPRQLSDPFDLLKAMEALSKADLFITRTKRNQAWGLLSYVIDLMTAGVALSRERTKPAWIPMKFPQRISLMSKTMRERALLRRIGNKIGKKCHVSSQDGIKNFIPYIRIMIQQDAMMASIKEWLGLDEEMVDYLES